MNSSKKSVCFVPQAAANYGMPHASPLMKHLLHTLPVICSTALLLSHAAASERINIAEDEASHSAYNGGWNDGMNSGTGFGPWVLMQQGVGAEFSHAGFFVGHTNQQGDLNQIATANRALATYANGVNFETTSAYRSIDKPIQTGDTFSITMETGDISRKYDDDDARPGKIGFSLRHGNDVEAWDSYLVGARFEFARVEGEENYQVFDGSESSDTGVPAGDDGVAVSVTLTGPDTYNLEITTLGNNQTTKLEGRTLGGDAGSSIDSFALFNLDGEKHDSYFNSFQVSRVVDGIAR